ncbi:hypothetical protein EX30DRAFT_371395 [Ascodesmis nigricans]|uniref:DUF7918 domain-containing protein n=1 Tax=Ascodesmis nigricans TaxID=341454 RepID=A0A4V3SIU8_9PEZI|nr:hypothetical protein EX30DRAFT_371395 [Ascodesmis nigricans]
MPTFKGVTVEIHCPKEPPANPETFHWAHVEHGPTPEYGTHKLRHTPKMTSYISAVTNCPFAVSIAINDSYEPKVRGDDRESLAAYVYFDGKQKEETATLLRRGVETWISSRWLEVGPGKLAEREFVFREVGLENIFGILDLSGDKDGQDKGNRRHSMPARMHEDEEETRPVKPKESAGQIRVDLFRVRCEGPVRRGVWGDMFKDHLNPSTSEPVVNNVDVSHTAGFSEPKPLDKDTVSTQSVSHLDPEGVVFASFVFYYRSERQLRKMNLIKDQKPTRSLTVNNTPVKPEQRDFTSFASQKELIPKGQRLSQEFGDFRDINMSPSAKRKNRRRVTGIDDDDDDDRLNADELGRDMKDLARELNKTEEEVRMEEELSANIERIKLKRSHSNTSLKDEANGATPPPIKTSQGLTAPNAGDKSKELEPKTPAKKRRGSQDADVKSPLPPTLPSSTAMQSLQGMSSFGGPPERGFGGFLNNSLSNGMDDEEEL